MHKQTVNTIKSSIIMFSLFQCWKIWRKFVTNETEIKDEFLKLINKK